MDSSRASEGAVLNCLLVILFRYLFLFSILLQLLAVECSPYMPRTQEDVMFHSGYGSQISRPIRSNIYAGSVLRMPSL